MSVRRIILEREFKFNREMFAKESLIKAAYNFIDDYYIGLDMDENYYKVMIAPKDGNKDTLNVESFKNEMLLQETRTIVAQRTDNLREMIYSRSLASTIITGTVPELPARSEIKADEILVDWFDENE